MAIRAGALRHRMTIERSTEGAADASGEKPITWSALRTVDASLTLQSGAEGRAGDTIVASSTYLVVMRHQFGITVTPKDRLTLGTRIFDIDSVADPDGRSRELQLVVRERLT